MLFSCKPLSEKQIYSFSFRSNFLLNVVFFYQSVYAQILLVIQEINKKKCFSFITSGSIKTTEKINLIGKINLPQNNKISKILNLFKQKLNNNRETPNNLPELFS